MGSVIRGNESDGLSLWTITMFCELSRCSMGIISWEYQPSMKIGGNDLLAMGYENYNNGMNGILIIMQNYRSMMGIPWYTESRRSERYPKPGRQKNSIAGDESTYLGP